MKKLQVQYPDIENRIQYAIDLIKQQSKAADDSNDNNQDESTSNTKENDKE